MSERGWKNILAKAIGKPADTDQAGGSSEEQRKFAAIDLGTNSFHLVIVQLDDAGRYEIVTREKESMRLGGGGGDLDIITPDAMERGISTLTHLADLARSMDAEIRAVATSAVREARNRTDFLNRAEKECGVRVEVAPGQEEARLIYLGILQALPVYEDQILMIDIGGGSTEYLVGRGGDVLYGQSLKIGAIRLKDRFFGKEPLKKSQVRECREYVRYALTGVREEVKNRGFEIAVGSSGTAATLMEMIHHAEPARENDDLRAQVFKAKQLDRIVEEILDCPDARERARLPGLDDRRADIIVAGAIILQESFRVLGISEMSYSPFALREGIIFDTLERRRLTPRLSPDIRRSSVVHLMETVYRGGMPGMESAVHIARLSRLLFDELRGLELLGELEANDGFLLEAAGMLHNIGVLIAHSAHHKHGYYMIRHSEHLLGFTRLETETVALLARYHRKALPSKKHSEYMALPERRRKVINLLGPLLRLAVALDRGGRGRVARLRARAELNKIIFELIPADGVTAEDLEVEVWAAKLKSEWFEKVYERGTEFIVVAPS